MKSKNLSTLLAFSRLLYTICLVYQRTYAQNDPISDMVVAFIIFHAI
jgi:hypothetical protein